MVRYYHGGRPGLRKGGRVLSPVVSGAKGTLRETMIRHGLPVVARADRVYVTTSRDAALLYAAVWPAGVGGLYEVEPHGELEPDPDCDQAGLSYACRWARVVAVETVDPEEYRTARFVALSL